MTTLLCIFRAATTRFPSSLRFLYISQPWVMHHVLSCLFNNAFFLFFFNKHWQVCSVQYRPEKCIFVHCLRERVKYYFADFVLKGGTRPPFTNFFPGKKGGTDLGGTPPFTDISPKNVLKKG